MTNLIYERDHSGLRSWQVAQVIKSLLKVQQNLDLSCYESSVGSGWDRQGNLFIEDPDLRLSSRVSSCLFLQCVSFGHGAAMNPSASTSSPDAIGGVKPQMLRTCAVCLKNVTFSIHVQVVQNLAMFSLSLHPLGFPQGLFLSLF